MGFLDRLCFAGLGFAAGVFTAQTSCDLKKERYRVDHVEERTYLTDLKKGQQRRLYDGLQLGSIEQRVEDLYNTSNEDLPRMMNALEECRRKYK